MPQQAHVPTGDDFFAAVEREDADIDAALQDDALTIGRSGRGIVTIGLFGGKRTTTDPDAIQGTEDNGRGVRFVRTVAKAIQNIDDFTGTARFPAEIDDAIYSGTSLTDPFGAYRFTVYLGDLDHRAHNPVMDGLVEYFETQHTGKYDIRAIEFDYDYRDADEKFRALYPWAKREADLDARDDTDGYSAPTPIQHLGADLRNHPLDARECHPLTITVHYYNSRSDRDGKYDREFTVDDFYGADDQRRIEKDRRSAVEQALDTASTRTRDTNITYDLTLTIDHDDLDALIENDDEPRLTTPDDVARHLGRAHHMKTYNPQPRSQTVTVGIVSTDETDDTVEYRLTVTARQRR